MLWPLGGFAVVFLLQAKLHFDVRTLWNGSMAPFLASHLPKGWIGYMPRSFAPWAHWALPATGFMIGVILGVLWKVYGPQKPKGLAEKTCMKFGKFSWSRNAFCRGWGITGATGTGKSQCGINIMLHQLNKYEIGEIRPEWIGSQAEKAWNAATEEYKKNTKVAMEEYREVSDRIKKAELDWKKQVAEQQAAVVLQELMEAGAATEEALKRAPAGVREARRKLDELIARQDKLDSFLIQERLKLQKRLDPMRGLRFKWMPWGGICMDQKGLFWETLVRLFNFYGRDADLCVLQTRPDWAGQDWRPPARFNLLSDDGIPEDTYAQAIVKTYTAMQGGGDDKGFFTQQGTLQIGWAIRLLRRIRAEQRRLGWPEEKCCKISLVVINNILSDNGMYLEFLEEQKCYISDANLPKDAKGQVVRNVEPEVVSEEINECLRHFESRYWNQPEEQRGGVISTIYNYLAPFAEPSVEEVFCRDNTFDLKEIDMGKVVCVSMPQKLAMQRRYVCTIIKILFYTHAQRRFDLREDERVWKNLIIAWQDEAQRFVIPEDGDVDTIREAMATTVLATQGQPSLFPPLGGAEKAKVILSNIRNRMIFKAASEDCAKASAEFIGKVEQTRVSVSSGASGTSTSTSKEEQFPILPSKFTRFKDFTCVVTHSEGKVQMCVVQPRTPENKVPGWWPTAAFRANIWLGIVINFFRISPKFWNLRLPKDARRC